MVDTIIKSFDVWTSAQGVKSKGRVKSIENISLEGIGRLRELILELAVKGRLVPQDKNDEPASELIKRIEKEKTKLIKEGKLKKGKPLPPISNEEVPFPLPQEWSYCHLGTLVISMISGGTPSKSNPNFWNGDIPWASVKDLGKSKYILETEDYITEEGLSAGSKLADVGDVIICTRMGLGKIGIAQVPLAINQDLKATRLTSQLDVDYFLIFFRTLKIKGTGTTVSGIKQDELLHYMVPLPPLSEQHRIVAKVVELMTLCDKLEREQTTNLNTHQVLVEALLQTLTYAKDADDLAAAWQRLSQHFDTLFCTEDSIDQLKQTILQIAVVGRLVKQDANDESASVQLSEIFKIKEKLASQEKLRTSAVKDVSISEEYLGKPNGWEYCRLGNLSKFIDYRGRTPNKTESGIPLITAKNIRQGYISRNPEEFISETEYAEWMTRGIPRKGDLLFTTEAPLGNIATIDTEQKFALAQRVICLQLHDLRLSDFLRIVMLSKSFQDLISEKATGMTATGIKSAKLKEVPVPIPPLSEQIRIVDKVDELMTLCDSLKTRIRKAEEIKAELSKAIVENAVA